MSGETAREGDGRGRRGRRNILKLALAAGGAAALVRARPAGAADGDNLVIGQQNEAGSSRTSLRTLRGGDVAFEGVNQASGGIGLRGNASAGVGVSGLGGSAGVRASGTLAGLIADGSSSTGIGTITRRGNRFGVLPTNTGLLAFAAFGTGIIGEGDGGVGIRGFSGQWNGTSAPTGVGVQGVGTAVGVLAQSSNTGTALRAVANSAGKAVDAYGAVSVNGRLNVTDTITGSGSALGMLAQTIGGGTAVRAIAPSDGLAVDARGDVNVVGDLAVTETIAGSANLTVAAGASIGGSVAIGGTATVTGNASVGGAATISGDTNIGSTLTVRRRTTLNGDVQVAGVITGNGSGLRALPATALTGQVPSAALPGSVARRNATNTYSQRQQFEGPVRINGKLFSRVAGRATIPAGQNRVDAKLPGTLTAGAASTVIATPQTDPGGRTFFTRVLNSTTIRIVVSQNATNPITFGWLVIN